MICKGSEWKRWDLHFHTPSSYDYGDSSVTNEDIIDEMKKNGISAFAITDHHEIDIARYKELKELGKAAGIVVLPGIEFLSDARGREPVHFIAIFSELSDIEHIWDQIKNRTAINKVRGEGRALNQVYCDLDDTIKLVKELNGIVSIHAGDKSGSIENITHSLPHGEAQKIEIANQVDIYELGKETDQEGYRKIVFPFIRKVIPMIICSDNHNIRKYQLKQKLWIKGSPNFEGLKYALNEPDERFFIGDEPPILSKVSGNKTKYIKSLSIVLSGKHDFDNIWFDKIEIPINSELVTIIGNKGSGKSAISDIIALCADAEHSADYLFLHKNKFKKKGLADRFSASLTFESGTYTEQRPLDYQIDDASQRKVRYLPQSYFEKVCNEIGKVEAFRDEIEKVVFQYVPLHKRLHKTSFKDLMDFKKDTINREIHHLIESIAEINDKIISIEDKLDPEYKKNLLSKKTIKEEELKVHITSKPEPLEDPSGKAISPEVTQKKTNLKEWEDKKSNLETEIKKTREDISQRLICIEGLSGLKRDIQNKIDDMTRYVESKRDFAQSIDVDLKSIITFSFDPSVLDDKIKFSNVENESASMELEFVPSNINDEYEDLNLQTKLERCNEEISKIQKEFTGEQKAYQTHLELLKQWEKTKNDIEGDENIADSLLFIIGALQYIENEAPIELKNEREKRLSLSIEIFNKKSEIKSFYDDIKSEIDVQLSTSKATGLIIASAFYAHGEFKESILRNVLQNKTGSFYGVENGRNLLQENLISNTNWNDVLNVKCFLEEIIEYLEYDKRDVTDKNSKTYIGNTVKDRRELYNYLFSLNYLEPHYDLQQNGKSLEQLSPGEKGALLLVFYLVLDKEDIPLIIDQPEDNLDNHSVAKVLVPFIKEAKKKRQIIIVTHNPNLAVVSDSEQVIRVSIDKENGNVFSFISGGIENCKINEEIVEVLEGTIPAFTTRKGKYQGV
jgi:ABC-type lipoprotein export system ATPase subunit